MTLFQDGFCYDCDIAWCFWKNASWDTIRSSSDCILCIFVFLQFLSRGTRTVHAIKCVKRKKIVHVSCQSLKFSFQTRSRPFADHSCERFFAQAFLQYKKLHLSFTFFYHPVNTSLPKEEQRRLFVWLAVWFCSVQSSHRAQVSKQRWLPKPKTPWIVRSR